MYENIGNLIFIIDKRFEGGKHSIYRYAPYVQYINVKHEISSCANVSFVSITALAEQESILYTLQRLGFNKLAPMTRLSMRSVSFIAFDDRRYTTAIFFGVNTYHTYVHIYEYEGCKQNMIPKVFEFGYNTSKKIQKITRAHTYTLNYTQTHIYIYARASAKLIAIDPKVESPSRCPFIVRAHRVINIYCISFQK